MSTSYGTYATTAEAKQRLLEAGFGDTSNDALIQTLCDQANQWIETRTHRILAPIAGYSSTLAADAPAGTQTLSVADASGIEPNDALMVGAVTGTHESGLVESVDTTSTPNTITLVTTLVAGFSLGDVVKRVYVFDGFARHEGGRVFPIGQGIRQLYSLEVTPVSAGVGGTRPQGAYWYLLPRQDYFIRPVPIRRQPSWPATEIWITNIPTPGDSTPLFFPGFNNVRIDADMGWPAVPDEIVDIALKLVVAAFRGRVTGGTDVMHLNVDGTRTYEYALSYQDKQTLNRYTLDEIEII